MELPSVQRRLKGTLGSPIPIPAPLALWANTMNPTQGANIINMVSNTSLNVQNEGSEHFSSFHRERSMSGFQKSKNRLVFGL
jgi:hypothetical protein